MPCFCWQTHAAQMKTMLPPALGSGSILYLLESTLRCLKTIWRLIRNYGESWELAILSLVVRKGEPQINRHCLNCVLRAPSTLAAYSKWYFRNIQIHLDTEMDGHTRHMDRTRNKTSNNDTKHLFSSAYIMDLMQLFIMEQLLPSIRTFHLATTMLLNFKQC